MTKVEALKKLYAKLGGTPADVANIDNIAEMVDKVADIAENGVAGLYLHRISMSCNEGGTIFFEFISQSNEVIDSYSGIKSAIPSEGVVATGNWTNAEYHFLVSGIRDGGSGGVGFDACAAQAIDGGAVDFEGGSVLFSESEVEEIIDVVERLI